MSHHCESLVSICTLQVLQISLRKHMSSYKNLQERIALRASMYFTHFLSQRDYDGKLRFNHEKERLEMQVHEPVQICQQWLLLFVCMYECVMVISKLTPPSLILRPFPHPVLIACCMQIQRGEDWKSLCASRTTSSNGASKLFLGHCCLSTWRHHM